MLVNEFSRVSGYEPVQSAGSYAGYKDWFIQDWRRPGFTVELGSGTNPLPISQFDDIYEESLGFSLRIVYVKEYSNSIRYEIVLLGFSANGFLLKISSSL